MPIDFSKYLLDIECLDKQHAEMFSLIEFLMQESYTSSLGMNIILFNDSLYKLECHFKAHIQLEESLMRIFGYPEDLMERHEIEHADFIYSVQNIEHRQHGGMQIYELIKKLFEHLELHVDKADRHLSEHVKSKMLLLKQIKE